MKRIISILFFSIIFSHFAAAQKFTIEVSKNKVAVGETFQIQFSVTGSVTNMKLPNINDFNVYEGPYQEIVSTGSSNYSAINYVIAAKKEGKFTIGPARATVNGAAVQSNVVIIEVTKGNQAGSQQNANQNSGQNSSGTNASNKILVKALTDKTKVVVGEQVSVTFRLYFNVDFAQAPSIPVVPSFDGFYIQDGNSEQNRTVEIVNGVRYTVVDIKKTFAIPQHSGKLVINPMELECVIKQPANRPPKNIIEQMMGVPYENVALKVKSKPVTIDVSPLPEMNKPANFSGAVGDYTYKIELSKDKVKANEAINLIVTLAGKGNIKLIDAPKINFPEDFEIYDPKIKDNISTGSFGVSGSKTFDYLVIPRHEGDYKINDLNFTFFNPAKNEYVTIPSPDLLIHVDKGDPNASANIYTPSVKDEVKILGNDIRYIKTGDPNLKQKNNHFFGSPLFYAGITFPFFAFIGFLLFRKKNVELNRDQIALKSRKATKMAKKRLFAAEKHLKENNKELFYLEISQALYGYLGDKLNLAGIDLNRENIIRILKTRGVSDTTSSQLLSTLDNCEYARYAPSAVSGDLNMIYNNTVELITKIENEIK